MERESFGSSQDFETAQVVEIHAGGPATNRYMRMYARTRTSAQAEGQRMVRSIFTPFWPASKPSEQDGLRGESRN